MSPSTHPLSVVKPSRKEIGRKSRLLALVVLFTFTSTLGWSQFIVTDLYNSVINTVSQTIQAASKIINSEAFKTAKKALEKLKQVEEGVQQFRRIQETAKLIESSIQYYQKSLNVIAEDRHFSTSEMASYYATLEKLAKQDRKLIDDLAAGIKSNLVEMSSADRMNFIMKIHGDAAASTARLKSFVAGIEYLSLKRCRTTNDRLATMKLYSLSRRGGEVASNTQVDFGNYSPEELDFDKMDEEGRKGAQAATQKERDWQQDPNNPVAKEKAIRSILNDPMPARPTLPKRPKEDDLKRHAEQMYYYQDRLENWQSGHADDLAILGTNTAHFVLDRPAHLTDKEWMEVLMNKLRKGQL